MSYRTIHLAISPQSTPTSYHTLDYACGLAQQFGGKLNVTSPQLSARMPTHFLGGAEMAGIARDFEQNAAAKSAELEQYITQKAAALGVTVTIEKVAQQWPSSASDLAWRGRTNDVCVLGLPQSGVDARLDVEDWIFGVGRPCLLYPNDSQAAFGLDSVLVSWDFSKHAARALFDALPILRRAQHVEVLIVRGEKDISIRDTKAAVSALLASHSITAKITEVDIGRESIGQTILNGAEIAHANVLVMGAYGHSRFKEFVLGGATREVLDTTRIPILMSH